MSFRKKLSITFSLLLLLTIIVSITSWLTMRDALNAQRQVYDFKNHVEGTFYAMRLQEQAFSAEETISRSGQVLDHIASMHQQLTSMLVSEKDQSQLKQLARVISGLRAYEDAFTNYVQQNLEMQTLRSRMEQEIDQLHTRADQLVENTSLIGSQLDHLMLTTILQQKNYIISPTAENHQQLSALLHQISQQIATLSNQYHSENIKLLIYRIDKKATTFAAIFEQFAGQQDKAANAHLALRTAFSRLSEEFAQAIATQTTLVNNYINNLQAIIVSASILALLFTGFAIIILSELITRPIDMLKQSALRIVSGDLNTSVEITSNDEIGQLGEMFNRMTTRLRTSFEELETYRDRLKDLVQERTHELELEVVERREAQRDLAISEERFRTIFDNSTDGILLCDPATKTFLDANRTICTMLGYSEEELLRLSPRDLHPEDEWQWIEEDFNKVVSGRSNLSEDIPIRRRDGSIFPAEISSALITIGGQAVLIGCLRDISERKTVEDERLKMRKLESVGVLAGGIAHDFNNILAAILGNTSLVLALTAPDDRRYPLLKELEAASLRARDLTQQLLTFSKGGEPVKEVTVITEIIRESASFILRGSNVRCDFQFEEGLWNAEVDAGQISQVIQNIVVNGRQAMPEGGIITISCHNTVPTAQASEQLAGVNCLEIAITDTGPGIPEDLQEMIFDPYFTTKDGGSGLGLAITHSIIRKHKGIISVHSAVGRGTTFTILLPAAQQESLAKEEPVSHLNRLPSGITVMLMDDEQPVREITSQLLTHLGYTPITVSDGLQAVEMYRQLQAKGQPVDLVIMDLTIPGGMGGREAAEKILAIDPDARLIVSSGYSHDPIMANFARYGFSGFLAKPFNLKDLQTTLEAVAPRRQT